MQDYKNFTGILSSTHPKAEKWRSQTRRVYQSLLESPKTRLQISHYEGIPIQNICRYIAVLKKTGSLCIVKVDRDELSGMKAEYLSVNPSICYPCAQLTIFS